MWTITLDGNALHVPGTANAVISPRLKQQANAADSLEFTIASDHPLYQACVDGVLTARYVVEKDGKEVSRGRLLSRTVNPLDATCDVVCEGELAYLNDSVLNPYEWSGSPRGLLQKMLDEHNAQCDGLNRLLLGTVTAQDANDYIVRGNEKPSNLMTELLAKTVNSSTGGWFNLRHSGAVTYLDWLENPSVAGSQTIAKGSNLLDISAELDGATLSTAIMPIGAKSGDDYVRLPSGSDGVVTGDVYRKGKFLYSRKLVNTYGWHAEVREWDDVTTSSNLRTRAINAIKSLAFEAAIEVSALDLYDAGYDVDSFAIGQSVPVTCDDIDGVMLITGASWDFDNPASSSFEFGSTAKSLTQSQSDAANATDTYSSSDTAQYVWHETGTNESVFAKTEKTTIASVSESEQDESSAKGFYDGWTIARAEFSNSVAGQWPGRRGARARLYLGTEETSIYHCGGDIEYHGGALFAYGEREDYRRRGDGADSYRIYDPAHDDDYLTFGWRKDSTEHSVTFSKSGIAFVGEITLMGDFVASGGICPALVQAGGSGAVTLAAGTVTQVPLSSSGAITGSLNMGFSFSSDGGIKCGFAGVVKVTCGAYISANANSTWKSVHVHKGVSASAVYANPSAYEVLSASDAKPSAANQSAICAGPKLVNVTNGEVLYLSARSVGAAGSCDGTNAGTYLLVERVM